MTANEAWIQNSLERLEELEAQREQLAAAGQSYKLAEVDEEIATLYETLEAVANEAEGGEAAAEPAAAAPPEAAPPEAAPPEAALPEAAAQAAASEAVGSPFEAPAASAAQPDVGSPFDAPAAEPAPGPVVASAVYDGGTSEPMFGSAGIDVSPPRSKAPLMLGLMVVVGGLVGGGWWLSQQKPAEPQQQATGDARVIDASAIPEDTQEPDAAKGGEADRTEGIKIRSSSHKPRRGGSRPSRPRSASGGDEKPGEKIKLGGDSKDPLGGLE